MKTSTLGRALELAALAARVGLKEARSGSVKSRLEQAMLIVNSLASLKGAAMKAGQLLSLDLNQYFPPEAIEILSQLQRSAVPQPYGEMIALLRNELDEKHFKEIENIAQEPIGVASIGQVHRARYHGRDIVLKMQYAGVADSIDSDLKILKTLASSFCNLTGRRMDLEPLFKEFRSLLQQEVDYRQEAQLQKEYGAHIALLTSNATDFGFAVPEVIDELSTERVLAMTYAEGEGLRSWLAKNPSLEKRQALATAVLDLYYHEFFEWGLVQTDPNWANFLIADHVSPSKLVLLDFGATRRYSREFIQRYVRLLHLAANKDLASLKSHAIEFGLIDARESDAAFAAFAELLQTAIRPFFSSELGSTHFDFSDVSHNLNSQNSAKALSDELKYSPPPYTLIFLHRKLAGVYSILKSLGVQMDVSGYWQKMLEYSK